MPADVFALSPADGRTIAIGFLTAGLLWVFGLLLRLVAVVGLKGLLHIRRSMARIDLAFIEKVGPEPTALLAAMGLIAAMFAAALVTFVVAATVVVVAIGVFEIALPLLVKGFLLGNAAGGTVTLAWIFAWHTWLLASAIINRDRILGRLRLRAELPA